MDLMNAFPEIFPLTPDFKEFEGFIAVWDQNIRVRILTEENHFDVLVRWAVARMLNTEESIKIPRIPGIPITSALLNALHDLKNSWENELSKNDISKPESLHKTSHYFKELYTQIEQLGWKNVHVLDEGCKNMVMLALDGAQRKHTLKISLQELVENRKLKATTELPVPFTCLLTEPSALTLSLVYNQFQKTLKTLQEFWNVMDRLDQNLRILEPIKPSRKDTKRRIALTLDVALLLNVDPLKPLSVPEFEFLGPDNEIATLQESLENNLTKWDGNIYITDNLKNILDIEFMPKQISIKDQEMEDQPCGICYSLEFNGVLPDKSCDNKLCSQKFHLECIHEWLESLEATFYSCGVLFGECPYCQKKISCPRKK